MNRKKKIWILCGGALLLVVLGVLAARSGEKGIPVQVATVSRENLQAKVSANGKIQAVKKVDISANIMGQVTRLAAKEGDWVKEGQFLLEIDPARSRASVEGLSASMQALMQDLETSRARFAQARSDFQRAQNNFKAGIISQAEFEQLRTTLSTTEANARAAQNRVDQARANLTEARVTLAKTTITAPMDGVVTAKRIEEGETAIIGVQNQPGTVLLTISDMSKVEAEMEVDEASIPTVKLGQEAKVRIDAYPNQIFQGVVTEVGGSPILKLNTNEATKFKVKVQIKNPPITIKPGLSTQADIFTGFRNQVLAVPIQALIMREIKPKDKEPLKAGAPREEEGIFVMENKKAKFVPIKTGLLGELNIEVLSGLKDGEQVITGPFKVLRELKGEEQIRIDKSKKKDDKKPS